MFYLLLFCILFAVWVYVILEPLTILWNRLSLRLADHVVGKRDHKDHIHVWCECPWNVDMYVCQLCGKLRI